MSVLRFVLGFTPKCGRVMAMVPVTVYYLEMKAPTSEAVAPPGDDLVVLHARRPSVAYYRFLYNEVGRDYHWYSRGRLTDELLQVVIQHPLNEIHVLHVDGVPAGFAELDRRQPPDIELVQFGLMPDFIGRGLGRWFLRWVIDKAWNYQPQRLWLHTCTLDHPRALPNYLNAGFVEFMREVIQRDMREGVQKGV